MNTSEKHVVISFSSSFIVCPKLLFSSQRFKNVEKSLLDFKLEVPISCSEESSVDTTGFESNSKLVPSSLEIPNESTSEGI